MMVFTIDVYVFSWTQKSPDYILFANEPVVNKDIVPL